jgi:flavin reductase (DIM6/NTAB) family NADH-FMN oxidoreductase RutF
LVSCADESGNSNIITCAWTGVICSEPPLVYISVRKGRHSYLIIENSKEFVINLATKDMAYEVDYCGTYSGREHDKFNEMKFTKAPSRFKIATYTACPFLLNAGFKNS